jgi:hypothetical protein
VDLDRTHWLVDVKSDRDLESQEVREKRDAAEWWAGNVTAETGTLWRYLLLGQSQITSARGSWEVMKRLYAGR